MYSVYAFLCCALLALSTAAAWNPDCKPCTCGEYDNWRLAECPNKKLTSVPVLPADTQYIDIKGGNISTLQDTALDIYLQLTRIEIQSNPFSVLPIRLFSKTQSLTYINFSNNKLKIINSHVFANLVYLEEVRLEGNEIAVLEDNCFFNVPKLITIDFSRNHISQINTNFIDNFNSLKHLHFHNNPVHCDDSVCELMNRVVQRSMHEDGARMPTCASPRIVQDNTWAEAVENIWGAGLEHCPKSPRNTVAEINRTVNALQEEVHVVKELVSTGTEEMHGLKDAVVQLLAKSHALFMEEMNKTMAEIRGELENMKNDLGQVKDKVNSLYVVKDGQQKLKDSVDVLMRQHEQIINRTDTLQSPNILFKEVLHVRGNSSDGGLLQLQYSVLPAPHNATGDL